MSPALKTDFSATYAFSFGVISLLLSLLEDQEPASRHHEDRVSAWKGTLALTVASATSGGFPWVSCGCRAAAGTPAHSS